MRAPEAPEHLVGHSKLSELDRWTAFGPFGADSDDRMTQEYKNLNGQAAHRALLSQLMMPHTRILAPKGYAPPP